MDPQNPGANSRSLPHIDIFGITSLAKEVMPKISMCGNDLELAPGFCGSISGSVNVTVGQPHIKVDSITVGGR